VRVEMLSGFCGLLLAAFAAALIRDLVKAVRRIVEEGP